MSKVINISFRDEDIKRKIWVSRRTKALEIINENLNVRQDMLSQSALLYLIELLKLDGEKEYLLKMEADNE